MDGFLIFCAALHTAMVVWHAGLGTRHPLSLPSQIALMAFSGANLGWLLTRMAIQ